MTKKAKKRQRIGTSTVPATGSGPSGPTMSGPSTSPSTRPPTCDVEAVEHHRRIHPEALAIEVDRSIDSDHTVSVLERIVAETGRTPQFLRMDNGPELTAYAFRDWCRFSGAGTSYIEPGSPWENPFIESFNGKLRDELLDGEAFETLLEAQVLAEDFRIDYNTYRPHSALGQQPPSKFAEKWSINQARLSELVDS